MNKNKYTQISKLKFRNYTEKRRKSKKIITYSICALTVTLLFLYLSLCVKVNYKFEILSNSLTLYGKTEISFIFVATSRDTNIALGDTNRLLLESASGQRQYTNRERNYPRKHTYFLAIKENLSKLEGKKFIFNSACFLLLWALWSKAMNSKSLSDPNQIDLLAKKIKQEKIQRVKSTVKKEQEKQPKVSNSGRGNKLQKRKHCSDSEPSSAEKAKKDISITSQKETKKRIRRTAAQIKADNEAKAAAESLITEEEKEAQIEKKKIEQRANSGKRSGSS